MIEYLKFWLAQSIVGFVVALAWLVFLSLLMLIPLAISHVIVRRRVRQELLRELARFDGRDDNWRNTVWLLDSFRRDEQPLFAKELLRLKNKELVEYRTAERDRSREVRFSPAGRAKYVKPAQA